MAALLETDTRRADVVRGPRRVLAAGAVLMTTGLAFAGTVQRDFGGVCLALGWGVVVFGTHAFGRTGARL